MGLAVAIAALAVVAQPPWPVACDAVTLRPAHLDGTHRVVLGRVAFPRRRVLPLARVGGQGFRYWSKVLLFVRPRTSVVVGVPAAWRARVGVAWGSPVAPAVRIEGCAIPPHLSQDRWNGFAGGFYARGPACVPLIVRAGGRSTVVRFGLGRPC